MSLSMSLLASSETSRAGQAVQHLGTPLHSPQPSRASSHLCPASLSCPEPLSPTSVPRASLPLWGGNRASRSLQAQNGWGYWRDASVSWRGDDSSSSKTLTFGELGVGAGVPEVLGEVQPPGDLCRSGPCRRPAAFAERVLVPTEHAHTSTSPGAMRCGWAGAGSIDALGRVKAAVVTHTHLSSLDPGREHHCTPVGSLFHGESGGVSSPVWTLT